MAQTVLIADDEAKLVKLVSGYLESAGFRTLHAADGRQAVEQFRMHRPDLVILDVMMPGMDGLEAARAILRVSEVPIIMLTARTEEADRVAGLELGADDYVAKPFSPRELLARVRAVLRRARRAATAPADTPLTVGGLHLDLARRVVTVDGSPRELTTAQFDLLLALASEPGRVFSRDQLLARIHEDEVQGYERTIDAHVKNLRKALGDDSVAPRFIGTVRGVGYRFLDPETRS